MSTTKNQHYVNQEYLRHFATTNSMVQHPKNKARWQICVFDKQLMRVLPSQPIRDVASEDYFYNLKGQPQEVEEVLSSLEGQTAPIHRKIENTLNLAALELNERVVLAKYIAVLYLRTKKRRKVIQWVAKNQFQRPVQNPVTRRHYLRERALKRIPLLEAEGAELVADKLELLKQPPSEQLSNALAEIEQRLEGFELVKQDFIKFIEDGYTDEELEEFASIQITNEPEHHAFFIFSSSLEIIVNELMARKWTLQTNDLKTPLYTSDNPVLTLPTEDRGVNDPYGALLALGWPDIADAIMTPGKYPEFAIVLPLNPRLLLAMYRDKLNPILSEIEVRFLNNAQVMQSDRQVYSHSPNFLDMSEAFACTEEFKDVVRSYIDYELPDDS